MELKAILLAIFLVLVTLVNLSSAVICYACTGAPRGSYVTGKPSDKLGYIYHQNENVTKVVPWEKFYQGDDCEQGTGSLEKVECQLGCLKAKFTITTKKADVKRTYRQCAHPLEKSTDDISKYAFNNPGGIKRAGDSNGVTAFFYYCNTTNANSTEPCNSAFKMAMASDSSLFFFGIFALSMTIFF